MMVTHAYESTLASYACKTCHTRGRVHEEIETPHRNQQSEMSAAKINGVLNQERQARIIADYIAGMTDRYALEEHERLFNVHVRP